MDEKTKLYVFERKEVALIFVFMVLIAITAFVLGVKIGSSYSYEQAGLTKSDREQIDVLSGQEEEVKELMQQQQGIDGHKQVNVLDHTYNKLEAEFDKLDEDPRPTSKIMKHASVKIKKASHNAPAVSEPVGKQDPLSGKWTVQLGSYRSKQEAQSFADGFSVRGYDPIINAVNLAERGVWYRVSLGAFETVGEAKDFIIKERTLFKGTDYVIGKFD